MKFDAIIQARMSSSRLPGKVLKKINQKPILWYLVSRLKEIKKINRIIIATTTNKIDIQIVKFCKINNIFYFRGSEKNCLKRICDTVKKFKCKNIIFLTGDCPIIDIKIINKALKYFKTDKYDYVGNSFVRSYPDGMDVQIFKRKTILQAFKLAKHKLEKEHVTLSIKKNQKRFKILNFKAPKNIYNPDLGLTLDQDEDFKLIKKIINYFKKKKFFSCEEIINLLKKKKNWLQINKNVKRKGDS
jgi:spore coat polysaccharide biosynthesis protein SpsF